MNRQVRFRDQHPLTTEEMRTVLLEKGYPYNVVMALGPKSIKTLLQASDDPNKAIDYGALPRTPKYVFFLPFNK